MEREGFSPISHCSPSSAATNRSKSLPSVKPPLACLNCRPKKIKCHREGDGCKRCTRLGIRCMVPLRDERKRPHSKKHVNDLNQRIRDLEAALRASQGGRAPALDLPSPEDNESLRNVSKEPSVSPDAPVNPPPEQSPTLIARLCGVHSQLNTDEIGQLHFFGPTSSLHVTDSVSSSTLRYGENTVRREVQMLEDVSFDLQDHLLSSYWKYQHTVLQVIHKEAFLTDMKNGRSTYFSKCLLYCIFACAARISDRAEVRALTLASAEIEDEQPYFIRKATALLELELKSPRITTIQSLQLLSVIECCESKDTKGWSYSGDACRLIFDLGLHKDFSRLESVNLSRMDLEARQVVFWGCFGFDRLWAMYLGRPHCIRLDDVTVPRPSRNVLAWDMQILAIWISLLDIIGQVSNVINGNLCTPEQAVNLASQLRGWQCDLPVSFQYDAQACPSVYNLHMQYSLAMILLHRLSAGFGLPNNKPSVLSVRSRKTCVNHATRIARILQDYMRVHGNTYTMLGSALYTITTAATTLIANIAEQKDLDVALQLTCLTTCIHALNDMEKTEIVARRIRKIIKTIMRLCKVEDQLREQKVLRDAIDGMNSERSYSFPMDDQSSAAPSLEQQLNDDADFFQSSPQSNNDVLYPFESWFGQEV